jgi:predicted Zn-dependent protease
MENLLRQPRRFFNGGFEKCFRTVMLNAMELGSSDLHHLKAAVGWLELGNAAEALGELDEMSAEIQEHPDVLEARWLALARLHRWEAAAKVARAIIAAAPQRATGWLHHAYALRRAPNGGLLAAFNALVPVADKFPEESTIPYNLACYTCQMQRDTSETMNWLEQAIKSGDRKEILAMAMKDPDLKPLRAEIKKLAKRLGP